MISLCACPITILVVSVLTACDCVVGDVWNVGNSFQMVQFDPGIELYSFASLYSGLVMMVKKRKEVGETGISRDQCKYLHVYCF
jgi:hypothetical protein